MLLQRIFYIEMPDWARSGSATLRYVLGPRRRRRFWWGFKSSVGVVGGSGLVGISWLAYHAGTPLMLSGSDGSALFTVLYFPLSILQFIALVVALVWSPGRASAERARGGWDMIRATSHGSQILVFAQWTAVFYEMRTFLMLLLFPRVLLAGFVLVTASQYQGYHLNLYVEGMPSMIPGDIAVIMLAAQITAALIQLPVLIGLNRAARLLILAALPKRAAGWALTAVFAGEIGLFWLGLCALQNIEQVISGLHTGRHVDGDCVDLLLGLFGDQGLRFMDLPTTLQMWTDIPHSVHAGAVLLILVMVQILLSRGMLNLAAWLASRPGYWS